MRAGARGYVLKGAHHDEILQAIRAVAAGQAVFGPAIAARMMNFFQGLNAGPQTGHAGFGEIQILGDYSDEPATADHKVLVFVARK